MSRRLAAVLAVLPLALILTWAPARTQGFEDADLARPVRRLADVTRAARLGGAAAGETTYVGYNPAYASPSNPWSIGVGAYRPFGGAGTTGWNWDEPVNGDSLQGWWPMRISYLSGTSMPANDVLRPWYALEINAANYVCPPGKKTFGVVGMWHADPGNISSTQAGTNPKPPSIPVNGTRSAWCGLRAHGDRTVMDGVTGNPFTTEAMALDMPVSIGSSNGGTGHRFPGYPGLSDQMLYRDVDVSARGDNPLRVRFQLRTRMSTNFITGATTRTGWTQWDPTTIAAPNFISSSAAGVNAPRDSFMVYVGAPIEPVAGLDNDYVNAAGQSRDIFDPLRRWFSEIVKIDGTVATGRYSQIYARAGNFDNGAGGFATVDCGATDAQLDGIGAVARLVFRVKTNRSAVGGAGNSDDENGSYNGTYNSGYGGAAVVDDIQISTDNGANYVTIGDFEPGSDAGNNIDNSVAASVSWRSTGKPAAIYPHVRDLSEMNYVDICGQPGNENRHCNTWGGVLSNSEYPNENLTGPSGTVESERWNLMVSPTICLAASGPNTPNGMGVTGEMADPTEDLYAVYDLATSGGSSDSDIFIYDGFQSYPAKQEDGTVTWSHWQRPGFGGQLPRNICETFVSAGAYANNLIYTTNANGIPDSIRIVIAVYSFCYRFGVANCNAPQRVFAYDNAALMLVDGGSPTDITASFWGWLQDAFPANEDPLLPGTAAFDTCAAWVQNGLNTAANTSTLLRHNVSGDTAVVVASPGGRVDVVFRILPGPGNHVTIGDPSSGLRRTPTSPAAITASDSSFWTSFLNDNGPYGTPGGHPSGPFAARWSPLVWNSARCDTGDYITAPVAARNWGLRADNSGTCVTMYHESELAGPRAALALYRNQCFLNDTLGALAAPNVNCGRPVEGFGVYPPAWVNALPASRTGYPKTAPEWPKTSEGTKVFPDGLFTPGTHLQYFFRREDLGTSDVQLLPDTNFVLQPASFDTDGHRWRTWSVLPDAWKKGAYGGLGEACMLYVDWEDGYGEERIWVSVADSIGATGASKRGAHNGWFAAGQSVLDADVDDPANFVRGRNAQAGSTWDKYDMLGGIQGSTPSGTLGARESHREPAGLEAGKDARNAPTQAMLAAYPMVMITTGGGHSNLLGPFLNHSQNEKKVLHDYLVNASPSDVRGLMVFGEGFVQSLDPGAGLESQVQALLAADLTNASYRALASDPYAYCPDLTPASPITSNGDVYGFNNSCEATFDVLDAVGVGVEVAHYPNSLPAVVMHPVNAGGGEYWMSLVTGFKLTDLRGRFCGSSYGRLRFLYDALSVFEDAIGSTCALTGEPLVTLDAPASGDGPAFRDFLALRGNPLQRGNAVIAFGLAKPDRVTLKVYDVTGRRVRTLLREQPFAAGEWEIAWDGADDAGKAVPRGVYFSSFESAAGRSYQRKVTVLR